jgi:hypothetical protein
VRVAIEAGDQTAWIVDLLRELGAKVQRRRGQRRLQGEVPVLERAIIKVIYDVATDVYVDVERQLAAALARD